MENEKKLEDLTELLTLWRTLYDAFLDLMERGSKENKKFAYDAFKRVQTHVVDLLKDILDLPEIDIIQFGREIEALEGDEAKSFQQERREMMKIKEKMEKLYKRAETKDEKASAARKKKKKMERSLRERM